MLLYSRIKKDYLQMSIIVFNKIKQRHLLKNITQQWCKKSFVDFLHQPLGPFLNNDNQNIERYANE